MEANELRIGNIVNDFSDLGKIEETVIQLEDFVFMDNCYRSGQPNSYKPIPLTDAWLERFWFKKSTTLDKYPTFHKDNINVNDGTVYLIGQGFLNHIKYVHQLQNLYFALTGKELISC